MKLNHNRDGTRFLTQEELEQFQLRVSIVRADRIKEQAQRHRNRIKVLQLTVKQLEEGAAP